jgi:hypothetical protein
MSLRRPATLAATLASALIALALASGPASAEPGPVVVGIVIREVGRTFAIIQDPATSRPGFYEVGAHVGTAVVTQILADRVVLDIGGQQTHLHLAASAGPVTAPGLGVVPAVRNETGGDRRAARTGSTGPEAQESPYGRIAAVVATAGGLTSGSNAAPGGSSSDTGGAGAPGGPGASSEGTQNGVSAALTLTGRLHDGRSQQADEFSTTTLRDLLISMVYTNAGDLHQQRVELYTPDGSLYQRLTGAMAPRTQTLVPVGGTWITEHSLFGGWRVDVFVDRETSPIASQAFTLTP